MKNIKTFFTKKATLRLILTIGTIALFSQCEQKETVNKSPRIRKATKIELPKYGAAYSISDTIRFKVSSNNDSISIDSILIYDNQNEIYNSNNHLNYSKASSVGQKNLRFNIHLSNHKIEYHDQKITVYSNKTPNPYNHRVINTFIHDPDAYTQGLIFEDNILYESTGQHGFSTLRKVDISTGKILKQIKISDEYFGEGITIFKDEIFMLTYKSHKGFVYDKNTFDLIRTFDFANNQSEGWGITTIGDSLIMSDGSEFLYFLDPFTFTEISRLQVYDEFKPIKLLNELEYINGEIFANIYHSDEIVIINPKTGQVTGKVDLTGIFNSNNYNRRLDVLNGIAYNPSSGNLYVTGKWWPKLFEIKITKSILNQ